MSFNIGEKTQHQSIRTLAELRQQKFAKPKPYAPPDNVVDLDQVQLPSTGSIFDSSGDQTTQMPSTETQQQMVVSEQQQNQTDQQYEQSALADVQEEEKESVMTQQQLYLQQQQMMHQQYLDYQTPQKPQQPQQVHQSLEQQSRNIEQQLQEQLQQVEITTLAKLDSSDGGLEIVDENNQIVQNPLHRVIEKTPRDLIFEYLIECEDQFFQDDNCSAKLSENVEMKDVSSENNSSNKISFLLRGLTLMQVFLEDQKDFIFNQYMNSRFYQTVQVFAAQNKDPIVEDQTMSLDVMKLFVKSHLEQSTLNLPMRLLSCLYEIIELQPDNTEISFKGDYLETVPKIANDEEFKTYLNDMWPSIQIIPVSSQ